jgi:hypothetical protein
LSADIQTVAAELERNLDLCRDLQAVKKALEGLIEAADELPNPESSFKEVLEFAAWRPNYQVLRRRADSALAAVELQSKARAGQRPEFDS